MLITGGLAACSSTPKSVNPVELYRSAAGFTLNDDTTGQRNAQNLEAGGNEPYPNLGTVPPPPDRAMSSIDRQKLQQGLTDDRTQAKQTDADLRASRGATAPTSITRPPSGTDGTVASTTKHGTDPSLVRRSDANGAQRRGRMGSEPPPQETALNSPTVRELPEGDTPRPAPPPPSLPPPEKARKPAADQAAKSPPAGMGRRPPPPSQTAQADQQPSTTPATSGSPPADAAKAAPPMVAAPPPVAPPTPPSGRPVDIPPPPPADMMRPAAPDKMAAVVPQPAPPAAPWPPALGPNETQKSPPDQTAMPETARPPEPPPALIPPPAAAKPPEQQQAALAPPPPAMPRAQEPEPATATPPRAGRVSMQAAEIKFADSSLTLTPDDNRRLADVVKLYDKHGGVVRVVGYGRRGYGADAAQQELASFSKAIERANVVAKALTQLGLASNRIVVQAAPIGDGLGEDRAEVLLEF